MWVHKVECRLLEFLSVFSPNTFSRIQCKNRDKHAISLGDPDSGQSVMNRMSQGHVEDVPDPGPVREWNDIVLHGDPRCGWNGRIQPQSFSHNVIQAHE